MTLRKSGHLFGSRSNMTCRHFPQSNSSQGSTKQNLAMFLTELQKYTFIPFQSNSHSINQAAK